MRNDSLPSRSKSYLPLAGSGDHSNRIIIAPEKPQVCHHVTLTVTEDDVHSSERTGLRNPLLCALQRQTKTLWRLYDDGFAIEAMPPYRACQLPAEAVKEWKEWQVSGEMEPLEFSIELVSNQARDGHSLIQRRHTGLRRKPRPGCE